MTNLLLSIIVRSEWHLGSRHSYQGCNGGGDLGSWDFSKIWDFGSNKGYLGSFFILLRFLKLFHSLIDDFKPKNHDFSQKLENFSKILAPAKPKFGIFPIFSAQKLGFPPKSYPLGRSPPPYCTPDSYAILIAG